ncbi:MAG: ATP-binding protein [archaeon]|jgi:hypothetical protein
MNQLIQITAQGIEKVLRSQRFTEKNIYKSISEFIWNGFDADASKIIVSVEIGNTGKLTKLTIEDNGVGIKYEDLGTKFNPFFDSEKFVDMAERNYSKPHGRRGIGRLTFFTFSGIAEWKTTYQLGEKRFKYAITINSNDLKQYSLNPKVETSSSESLGTIVSFDRIIHSAKVNFDLDELEKYLALEFGWWLKLNDSKGFEISLNNKKLDYSRVANSTNLFEIITRTGIKFEITYIQWKEKINNEFSKFYYIGSDNNERYKENTTLNNKGDEFFHSVFIKSPYFDSFSFILIEEQQSALTENKTSETYKLLMEEIEAYLRKVRKPFLKETSYKLIEELQKDELLPKEPTTELNKLEKIDMENVLKAIYEIQPKVFSQLNYEQKKTILALLKIMLNSEDRKNLITILESLVKLEPDERKELSDLLEVTTLSNILKTLNLIKHRFEVIQIVKLIHFDDTIKANEIDHLQKIIEDNTWIFGEQYSLLAAAEDNFDTALKNYRKKIYDSTEYDPIRNEFKNGQVDIFMCRQDMNHERISNLIVELKHPKKTLGDGELSQVKKYYRVISGDTQFNSSSAEWEYILIGGKFDSTKAIENEIKNMGSNKTGLCYHVDNHKIYAKKWSDVLFEVEIRLKFLQDKLEIQKNKLAKSIVTADEAVSRATS